MTPRFRDLSIRLPEATYRQLRAAAERTKQPVTELARQAVEAWLRRDRRRSIIRRQIARYASAVAGTRKDLDGDLEAAAPERRTMTTETHTP